MRVNSYCELLIKQPTSCSRYHASRYINHLNKYEGFYVKQLQDSFEWLAEHESDWHEYLFKVSDEF